MNNLEVIDNNKQLTTNTNNNELLKVLKEVYAKDATNEEVKFFAQVCKIQNLDPVKRQIYFVKMWDSELSKNVLSPVVSIDGMRSKADETGFYAGQTIPLFCGKDGIWKEIWTQLEPPFASKVGVIRKDFKEPLYAIAQFDSYAKRKKDGTLTKFWKEMGCTMIAKCAESLALRKAFPQNLSGLYSKEERHKDIINDNDNDNDEDYESKKYQNQNNITLKNNDSLKFNTFIEKDKLQNQKNIEIKKEFEIIQEFQSRKQEFIDKVNELIAINIGKYDIDKDINASFKEEFLLYFKDKFTKKYGNVDIESCFLDCLNSKRITILALAHNAVREEVLSDDELKDLKHIVKNEFEKDKTQNIVDIFCKKASEYIKF